MSSLDSAALDTGAMLEAEAEARGDADARARLEGSCRTCGECEHGRYPVGGEWHELGYCRWTGEFLVDGELDETAGERGCQ